MAQRVPKFEIGDAVTECGSRAEVIGVITRTGTGLRRGESGTVIDYDIKYHPHDEPDTTDGRWYREEELTKGWADGPHNTEYPKFAVTKRDND